MASARASFDFGTYAPSVLRSDTRIYFVVPGQGGACVGTVVMENPGNAPKHLIASGLHFFSDPTVTLLCTLTNDIAHAAVAIGKKVRPGDYIEILNLYYFCDSNSMASLPLWMSHGCQSIAALNPSPASTSRFVLIAWGQLPHLAPSLGTQILGMCTTGKPTYMVDGAGWSVRRLSGVPVSYPTHPYRFSFSPLKRSGVCRMVARTLAPHL